MSPELGSMQIRASIASRSDKAASALLACLGSLISAPYTRVRVISPPLLAEIGCCVQKLWAGEAHDGGHVYAMGSSSQQLQSILETLFQPQDLLLAHGHSFVTVLLPSLCVV
jgi:hypothetical protein